MKTDQDKMLKVAYFCALMEIPSQKKTSDKILPEKQLKNGKKQQKSLSSQNVTKSWALFIGDSQDLTLL